MRKNSNRLVEWAAFGLLSVSLAAAVLLRGGVYPAQWAWSAMGIALASLLVANPARADAVGAANDGAGWLIGALMVWMVLPLVPLPPGLAAVVSPERWGAISAARSFTGGAPRGWVALSVAPGATFERLADVVPAMAAFFAIRTLCIRWGSSQWVLAAPVIIAAWLESLLGMLQFRTMRGGAGAANAVTGTYANRDHFAALLEMAFPLVLLWAVSLRRHWRAMGTDALRPVLAMMGLFLIAGCLLLGVVFSASRMGFVATLGAGSLVAAVLLRPSTSFLTTRRPAWRWVMLVLLPASLLVALPTRELLDRYREVARPDRLMGDPRVEIWRDSLPMVAAYKWAGSGLGAFEYGFYRFDSRLPMNTVDFAHNDYLQIIAELGIFGAALAAALALWIVWRLGIIVLGMRGAENWELAVGLLGALFAIGLHSFADFNLYIPANALVVAWLCGIADSAGLRRDSSAS